MFYGAGRDVPDLRRPDDLPLRILALQRGHLQLVPRADPLAGGRIAEAEGVKHERAHPAILAYPGSTSMTGSVLTIRRTQRARPCV